MGHPIVYSEDVANRILERIAAGETLRSICREQGMPAASTVCYWALNDQPAGFAERYARAREMQVEAWADEIVEISDDRSNDTHTTTYGDGTERTSPNTEWISSKRLRVDSRKWLMSKLAPKKYGDQLKIDGKMEHGVTDTAAALLESIAQNGTRFPPRGST